jgi:hypothetical protein
MHLNREYVYDGKQYELEKLFVIRDITDETAAVIQDVRDLIRDERKVLAKPTPPDIKPEASAQTPSAANSTTSATSRCRSTTLLKITDPNCLHV